MEALRGPHVRGLHKRKHFVTLARFREAFKRLNYGSPHIRAPLKDPTSFVLCLEFMRRPILRPTLPEIQNPELHKPETRAFRV